MAGIGFELEKLFEKDTYSGDVSAYTAAGVVLAGSWVFGVMSIILITLYTTVDLNELDQSIFICMATYSYAGAMLITGPLNIPVTRFIADRLYTGSADAFGPTYAGYCMIHWIAAFALGATFYGLNPISVRLKVFGILLLVSSCQVWLSTAFISLLRAYRYTAFSFFTGYLISTLGSIGFGRYYGLEGYVGGFTLGMMVLAVLLTAGLQVRFAYPTATNFSFFGILRERPGLLAIGTFLAIGTWIDKAMFWALCDQAYEVTPYFRFYPPYDVGFFLGYITAVPAFAHFLLRIETSFARQVRHIYSALVGRESYQEIHKGKVKLAEATNADFVGLIKLQGPVALLCIYFAPEILDWLKLPAHFIHIFQYSVLSACGLVLVQVQVLYLLYFDLAGAAAIPAIVYGVGNVIFTYITIKVPYFGFWSYGLGHLAAAYLAFMVGYMVINRYLVRLDYIVLAYFARESIRGKPQEPAD